MPESRLDPEVCERARLARDKRFDGRFFIGVRTTGIYCRPVCPVRPPKRENVEFFPSAAAAHEAGYRPCLRCRPEAAPGSPAWVGTSAVLSRALSLIETGALDSGSVDELAERLGIGARHLRRLFVTHLGASPKAVAQTRRLHFAKQLITETNLPMTQIALAAGFGSLRRFNSTLRGVYGRTPTELRRAGSGAAGGLMRLSLPYRPPFDWEGWLDFVRPRGIPGVEQIVDGQYQRTIAIGDAVGFFGARAVPDRDALELEVRFSNATALSTIVDRAGRLFDVRTDPLTIVEQLGGDPRIGPLIAARPGLRVPGAWDGFELAVRAVLGQQVTVAGASTLAGRLASRFGKTVPASADFAPTVVFPAADALVEAPVEEVGMPARRGETLRQLARRVVEGDVVLDGSAAVSDVRAALLRVPGIGDWTAEYVAMRALGDPDAFPSTDLGLKKALGVDPATRAQPWRPWRAYAAVHLWRSLSDPVTAAAASPSSSHARG